mmetsp:Transcript_13916/g.23056  ORF Transcript_13916/g.23056 Transcript_13916/m.23056 type:complete len:83 (+) Transcript_13916:52-300(+)
MASTSNVHVTHVILANYYDYRLFTMKRNWSGSENKSAPAHKLQLRKRSKYQEWSKQNLKTLLVASICDLMSWSDCAFCGDNA